MATTVLYKQSPSHYDCLSTCDWYCKIMYFIALNTIMGILCMVYHLLNKLINYKCMQHYAVTSQGPVSLTFFHRYWNSMENTFHFPLDANTVIATKCSTWHDSCAVMTCAKFCCDLMVSKGITTRQNSHWIWIAGKKSFSETGPSCMEIQLQGHWPRYLH